MHIVHVFVHVRPEAIEDFKAVVVENARHSVQEPGIIRFDVIQQKEDPTRFVLVEVYRTEEDVARHKETAHYLKWRDAVPDLLIEPRYSIAYNSIFPDSAA